MFAVGKPTYVFLGRREPYAIRNRQAKKNAIFEEALTAIHRYTDLPNFVSILDLVAAIYHGGDPQLKPICEALKSNALFQRTTRLSASGQKILAYLAILHDKNCLTENGGINLAYTKQIMQNFFSDEIKNTIQFDDSTIRNLKSKDTHFQFGKNRFAHLTLPFSSKDNIDTVQNKIQAHIHKQESTKCLFQACYKKDLAAAQEALHNGADANSRSANDNTPLMLAAHNGWLEMAIDLFSKSTDDTVNTLDKCGQSVLIFACAKLTNIPFLTQLLARSSPEAINTSNKWGNRPLLIACTKLTDIPFLTQLLERSSDTTINAVDQQGITALLYACAKLTDIPFLTRLLERSSIDTINTVTTWGDTALISLLWRANKPQPAQHLVPLILPHLTWANFRSAYKQPNIAIAKTAWQLVHNRRLEPWTDVTRRVGEAMLVECAQRHIPWGRPHHNAATQKKRLTQGKQTPANVCEDILDQKKIPVDILGIIRNYNESAFNTPKEALDAINDFLKRHLQRKEQYRKDGSQLFNSVDDVMGALHDYTSELNISLAEYASTLHAP